MKERLELAKDLALKAGVILRQGYGHGNHVDHKGIIDLITEYDLRSESLIVEGIRSAFPQDAILAEEGGEHGQGDLQWLVDPLDGTTNFAHKVPCFSISIAVAHNRTPLLGVVYEPMRDDLFWATSGGGAWLGERRISVSRAMALHDSLLVTGFPYDIRTNPETNLDHFAALSLRSRGVRRLGSAALDLAYVAAGRFDGYWEFRLWPWDWSAGMLLVQEAGGRVSRTDGGLEVFKKPTSLLATNGHIHEAMMRVLNRTQD